MTGKDRIAAVFRGEPTDRPVKMEMFLDEAACRKVMPIESYYDFFETDFYDMVTCRGGVVRPGKTNWIDREQKIFRDKWGATQQFTDQFLPHIIGDPVISELEDFDGYQPPDPYDEEILSEVRQVAERYGDRYAIVFLGEDVFAPVQDLLGGPENAFVALKLEPEIVERGVALAEAYHTQLYLNAIAAGAEFIILGDDYGTNRAPMISPADFRSFFKPALKRMVDAIHQAGAKVIKHTDGNVWMLMDDFVEIGFDALGPLQHECGMHLDVLLEKYPHMVFVGNVPVDLLITGTPEEVAEATRDCLRRCSGYHRHILSSGNSITADVPEENLRAMICAAMEV